MHYLKERTGAPTAIGARVVEMQALWRDLYNLPPTFQIDGSQWDRLLREGDTFTIGDLGMRVLHSPGHTLASVTYVIGDAAFVHDTLFMPDSGTARADFPGGDARSLWRSIQALLTLPDDTARLHGSRLPAGRTRSGLGEHDRRPTPPQPPPRRGFDRSGLRVAPIGSRPGPADAEAHPARPSGQRGGRPVAGAGGERANLPEDPPRRARWRCLGVTHPRKNLDERPRS